MTALRSLSALGAGLGAALCATAALGQIANAPPAWATNGYAGAYGAVSQPYAPIMPGAGGNATIVNGELQNSASTSVASQFAVISGGAGYSGTGAGYATATSVGNLVNVQVTGSGDTVIVNAAQTNNASIVAGAHP